MAIAGLLGIIKGVLFQDPVDRTKELSLEVSPSATTGTRTSIIAAQTANRTITLPDSNFDFNAVITNNSVGTLTNKTIDGDTNTLQDIALVSLKAAPGSPNTILSRDVSGVVISTIVAPTGSIIGSNDIQTLTNKTIDGDDNTVQDLPLSSLKADGGAPNQFVTRDGSGIVISAKPVPTGTVVGTTDVQTLTNKTLTTATISNSTVTLSDTGFTLRDNGDATKQMQFDIANVPTATIIALATPSASTTLVGTDSTQTLSNKTFADALLNTQIATPANPSAGLNKLYFKSDNNVYRLDSSGVEVQLASAVSVTAGSYSVTGARGVNNTGTPNTQYDMSADAVILKNASNEVVARYNTGTVTNNISTAGPAANGRDQAGAFSASSWVHFYWIWNGSTLATLSSTVAPTSAPTLPSGYTHWAYMGAIYLDSGSALTSVTQRGSWIYRNNNSGNFAGSLSSTSAADVSLAAGIPPNALSYQMSYLCLLITNGSGLADGRMTYYSSGSVQFEVMDFLLTGLGASSNVAVLKGTIIMPNFSGNLRYAWSLTAGTSPSMAIRLHGYKVANGGE